MSDLPCNDGVRPWTTKTTRPQARYPIFSIRKDNKTSPRTGADRDFYVVECSDWVNVVALTTRQELVMIQQYRHGTESVELEIPGGAMDAQDDSPVETAIRELREETGYEGKNARIIGDVRPNPAIMNNTCRTVLIEECERLHPCSLDAGEDIATELMSLADVRSAVSNGRISHALVIVALYYFDLYQGGTFRRQTSKRGG